MNTFAGRKLGRPTGHRFSMFRQMASSLLHHEKIETTLPKAREVARFTERLISQAKAGTLSARRRVASDLHDRAVKAKLFDTLVPRYKGRSGGYTHLIRKGPRLSDGAEMVILRLIAS
jgi:large subunit ribosomal protein L17